MKLQALYLAWGQALSFCDIVYMQHADFKVMRENNVRVMDYWVAWAEFLYGEKYIQYLSLKYLINKALWSQWFEAENASVPSTEGVLIKLFNIQLRKIKNMFCNCSVFFLRWSLFVQEGSPLLRCANEVIMSYLDTEPWSLCGGGCSLSQNAAVASFCC